MLRATTRATLLWVLAGCSAPSSPRPGPPPAAREPGPVTAVTHVPADAAVVSDAAATARAPEPIDDGEPVAWTPHVCRRSVWESSDPDPVDAGELVSVGDDGEGLTDEGGRTLDEKARAVERKRPREVCDPRDRHALAAQLARLPAVPPSTAPRASWDHVTPLEHRAKVGAALALTAAEERHLEQHGFVVPARLQYKDYTSAYYDIHRGELPVYVSADSILHAVYASHDQLFARVEQERLVARLDAALGAMHCGLAVAAKQWPDEIAHDVDLYLTVARSLLADTEMPSELGKVDAKAAAIASAIRYPSGLRVLDLFGRTRWFDTTAYEPRGHYTEYGLTPYFRAAMWLSRLELNLVSRDTRSSTPGLAPDPTETPREAVVALALAELAKQSGARADLDAIEHAWTMFAGRREDVSLGDLATLRTRAGIHSLREPDAAAKLRAAIGTGFRRTVNVHPNPTVPNLPVIATVIGARITPDTAPLGELAALRGRELDAGEVGFLLGHDRGLAYAGPVQLDQLQAARAAMQQARLGPDLYSAWLDAVLKLADEPAGAKPSFMESPAFDDLRLDSAIAAYGQLRHNHVLVAAQIYDAGGCEIPDGYVEPAIDTYRALAEYARRGRQLFLALDRKDRTGGVAYFTRLEQLLKVLVALSREELANRPLSPAARRFLAMIVEQRQATATGYNGTFPIATWDGWYIDLFPQMELSFEDTSFVADYATWIDERGAGIHYLGAKGPRLGVFVVDTGGKPRVMVGPVANAFGHTTALDQRLGDEAVAGIAGEAPWQRSYTIGAPAEPALALEYLRPQPRRPTSSFDLLDGPRDPRGWGGKATDRIPENTIRLEAPAALGEVTLELLDHHFVKLGELKVRAGAGRTDTVVPPQARPIEAIRVRTGAFSGRVDLNLEGYARHQFGAAPAAADDE